jgi:hypothetical protein
MATFSILSTRASGDVIPKLQLIPLCFVDASTNFEQHVMIAYDSLCFPLHAEKTVWTLCGPSQHRRRPWCCRASSRRP